MLRTVVWRDHGWTPTSIDDAIELVRWAEGVLGAGGVRHVVGDDGDVRWALEVAEEGGLLTSAGAAAMAARIDAIGATGG